MVNIGTAYVGMSTSGRCIIPAPVGIWGVGVPTKLGNRSGATAPMPTATTKSKIPKMFQAMKARTSRETRLANQRDHEPRRRQRNGHIAQRGRPGEIARQKSLRVKAKKSETGESPRLGSSQQADIGGKNKVVE